MLHEINEIQMIFVLVLFLTSAQDDDDNNKKHIPAHCRHIYYSLYYDENSKEFALYNNRKEEFGRVVIVDDD